MFIVINNDYKPLNNMIIASLVVMSSPTTKLLESSSPLQRLDQLVTNSSRVFKVTLVFQKTVIIGDNR